MSGIVGMFNRDGAPADRDLLLRMARRMADRAPDGLGVWSSGHVGLGLAMLRIAGEPVEPEEPHSLDGKVWIVADARIDGRDELTASLRAAGRNVEPAASSAALILHAYRAFADSFVEHLVGDFAFALWDANAQKLICARDHFGIRPFFYANKANSLLFASDPLSLLECSSVTSTPDEEAIGDLFIFGSFLDFGISAYRDIRRLQPAHRLVVELDGQIIRRYWTVPLDSEIRYRRDSDYVEHFSELFRRAVDDRSRASRVAFEMSGGLDSTGIAAVVASRRPASRPAMTAYTITCDRLLSDDREGYYAGLVASHLSMTHERIASEDYAMFALFNHPRFRTAEPGPYPDMAIRDHQLTRLAVSGTRVLLSGQGGDEVFCRSSDLRDLLRRGRILRAVSDLYRQFRATGSLTGAGLRTLLRGSPIVPSWHVTFPDWLDPAFVRRTRLRDRWVAAWELYYRSFDAYRLMTRPWLSFDAYEALQRPVVARHPFYDIRLVAFMLGLPDYLKFDKRLLRASMKGALPEAVRSRPKTGVCGDLMRSKMIAGLVAFPIELALGQITGRFIVRDRYLQKLQEHLHGNEPISSWPSWQLIGPIAINCWLDYDSVTGEATMALRLDQPSDDLPSSREATPKRRYFAPRLSVLGDVKALTGGAVGSCHDDGNNCSFAGPGHMAMQ